jgi:hypothetical protein
VRQLLGLAVAGEPWWQEALRWSTIALSASLIASETLLWMS